MRVLVTGSSGFAGRWLLRDLAAAGHEAIPDELRGGRVEITDAPSVGALLRVSRPDLIIHLAAMAFGPDAESDAAGALKVNVGGMATVLDAMRSLRPAPAIVVVSSAEVYGRPASADPLTERAPVLPTRVYGLSKLAQESVALAMAAREGLRAVVVRPFNHTGPGQRRDFAVPAFASRIVSARAEGATAIRVGNVDVRRDIGDVRDTVRAYRSVGEALVAGRIESGERLNVSTGVAVTIASIIERLAEMAGHPVGLEVDPELVRPDDPPVIVGDSTLLRRVTGWAPEIPLERTLADLLADVERSAA